MSEVDLILVITRCQTAVMLACCALTYIGFSHLNKPGRLISFYLFFQLVLNTAAALLAQVQTNNLMVTHLLVLGEFILLSLFFNEVLKGEFYIKKYFRYFLALVGSLIMINTLFVEKINTFNTNAKTLVLFIIIFLSTTFFYDRSIRLMVVDAREKALRIIVSAILIYYSGSFFVYLFYKYTANNKIFYSHKVLIFNAVLYLVFTVLMLVAFLIILFPQWRKIIQPSKTKVE